MNYDYGYAKALDVRLTEIERVIVERLLEEHFRVPRLPWPYSFHYMVVSRYTDEDMEIALQLLDILESSKLLTAYDWGRAVKRIYLDRVAEGELLGHTRA